MFRFQRTGRTKNGRTPQAILWAKEIAEYLNGKYPQISIQVYTQFFGDFHSIHWTCDYKDLATIENIFKQMMLDQGYWALVNKGMEMFIEGGFNDSLMSSV